MLNTTADLKSVGQPENTDTATSTSLQNKDRAPSHLAGLEVKKHRVSVCTESVPHDKAYNTEVQREGERGKATASAANVSHCL